jgi:hypothetical protein
MTIRVGAAAGCVMMAALWLATRVLAFGADTPIIVRDGSIRIENPGGDLKNWKKVGSAVLDHPDGAASLRGVEVSGPGAQGATCEGKGRCVVEMTWSTGQSVRIVSKQNGNKGARLVISGVSFDDPGWDKSGAEWRFDLPAGAVPTVTISDQSTGGQAQTICQGNGCRVLVHYQ